MRISRFVWGTFLLLVAANVTAATYYIKPAGDDSGDGKTHATAWKTVGKANSFPFQPGDDLYFLVGSEWIGQLVVDWSGTTSNSVEIGSYYVANGAAVPGLPAGSARPTLVGGYPKVNVSGAIPGPYAGLIEVRANYVTVRDMRTYKSSGTGINLAKGFHHALFEDNRVEITAGSSILFQRGTHDNTLRGNEASYCAQAWKDGTWVGVSWPICNGAVGSSNNLMEHNYIHESYGEGIVALDANNNVIRDNLLVWVRSANVYVDNGSDNLIERNIMIGNGGNGKFAASGNTYTGNAVGVNVEDYSTTKDAVRNIFRNNLAAGTGGCFNVGMELAARAAGHLVGGEFAGNTCVGSQTGFNVYPPAANISTLVIANNIIHDTEKGGDSCKAPASPDITFQNNRWTVIQNNTSCRGDGDRIGDPSLTKATGWRSGGPDNIFEATDFQPKSGSPVVGAGRALGVLVRDYFDAVRPNPPSMGAIEADGRPTVVTPSGVKLTVTQ